MTSIWALAALWLGLALIASLLSIWLRVSTALSEIVVGTVAQLIIGAAIGAAVLGTDETWVKVLSGTGAIVLTFLAGSELDPQVFRHKWKEATAVGLVGFFFPFFGCAAAAYYILGWQPMPSWLAGVALSTTSVAVVYSVMLEFGLNKTEYGKTVLAACFINDLGTVLVLGFIFSPFTLKTLIFGVVAIAAFAILPWLTPRFFKLYGNRPSELETKFLLFCLFGLGALDLTTFTNVFELKGIRHAGRATGRNLLEWPLGEYALQRYEGAVSGPLAGPTAKQCSPPISSAWCWPAPSARITP